MAATPPRRPYGGISAQERIAARRERLLDAGLELFGTRGFARTGVKDLCREAGLTDRYFYESFADSQQLFLGVFDRLTDELFAGTIAAVAAAGAEPEAQLRGAISTFLRTLAEDPRKPRVLFFEAAAAGPEAAAHMRATLRRFTDLVAATAGQHSDAGEESLRVYAMALVGTLERVVTEREDGNLDVPLERLVDRCVGLFAVLLRDAERA